MNLPFDEIIANILPLTLSAPEPKPLPSPAVTPGRARTPRRPARISGPPGLGPDPEQAEALFRVFWWGLSWRWQQGSERCRVENDAARDQFPIANGMPLAHRHRAFSCRRFQVDFEEGAHFVAVLPLAQQPVALDDRRQPRRR